VAWPDRSRLAVSVRMTNTCAATRTAILLSIVLASCQGRDSLGERHRSDGGQATDDDPRDATSARDPSGQETADAMGADAGPETADATAEQSSAPQNACAQFDLRFTGAGASPYDCPTIDCDCPDFLVSPVAVARGCVQSVDCAAACASGEMWLICALDGCASDRDCDDDAPDCVDGLCSARPYVPPKCASDLECPGGKRCVATQADGSRTCVETATNDRGPCNQDADCPAGHCALPSAGILGVCSTGANFADCFTDANCASGLHCKNVEIDMPGTCSDGSDHAPCERDGDCRVGRCLASSCTFGALGDDCRENADCQSGFCAGGRSCTTGAVDAACAQDADCASGRCANDGTIAACTIGAPSSKCVDDHDCVSGACRRQPGADVTAQFGACE
ncbi:MAG TPA: hypothetical protein VK989_01945, partial [Polyangia bacterium]|nr:hypothetical protein [Polyangia bacterium]